ncbi:MAG: hypothetical protein A2020_01405 [Lentisphaerae bacterium GWF2_45_14]|nr:MAG: hypothetical protein A2020_01405 [Lentisphaerae bacterium GWF2_45_14]
MNIDILDLLDSYPDTVFSCGDAALIEFSALLQSSGTKKIAFFTGRNSADKSGALTKILSAVSSFNVESSRFSEIEEEPCIETVYRMLDFLKNENPDAVAAIGGGSIMDAAKAAYLLYQAGGTIDGYFGMNKFSTRFPEKHLKKVFCFPITSGTGSEATPYSNIVDKKAAVKKLIVEKEIIPAASFLIPEFTMSMPSAVTKATALDALAHCLEGFLNITQDSNHPMANEWAVTGIKLVTENLPRAMKNPSNLIAREGLAAAACLGGMVIRYKSTGLPHLCSFSWFGRIAHGIAVAVLLPYAWSYYLAEEKVRQRTMKLRGIFPGPSNTAEDILHSYIHFLKDISVPTALRDYPAIDLELLKLTARTAGENKMKLELAPRPVPLEKSGEVLGMILSNAYNGTV